MAASLVDQFLQECTPYVRRLLEEAIADNSTARPRFEFDRFGVTIGHDTGEVILDDVLDATETGVQRVALSEFADALSRRSA